MEVALSILRNVALAICGALASCAAPGCHYEAGNFFTQTCPAKEAAAAAQAEATHAAQEREAAIRQAGSVQAYEQQQHERATEAKVREYRILNAACLQQMPVPVSAYQDKWEQDTCARQTLRYVWPGSP